MDLLALKTRLLGKEVQIQRDERECVMTAASRSCFALAPLFHKSAVFSGEWQPWLAASESSPHTDRGQCHERLGAEARPNAVGQVWDGMLNALETACFLLDGSVVGPKATGLELKIQNSEEHPPNFAALSGPSGFAKPPGEPERKSFDKQTEVLCEIRSRFARVCWYSSQTANKGQRQHG